MKKYVSEFVKRGLMAAAGGPVVLAIVYGIMGITGTVQTLTPAEVCQGILSVTLMAFIIAGISMIYTVESLPLGMAILLHAGVLYLDYLIVYLTNSWIPKDWHAIGGFTMIFVAGYATIWLVIYLCVRAKTDKVNERMNAQ